MPTPRKKADRSSEAPAIVLPAKTVIDLVQLHAEGRERTASIWGGVLLILAGAVVVCVVPNERVVAYGLITGGGTVLGLPVVWQR